jgi:hypothetical protein
MTLGTRSQIGLSISAAISPTESESTVAPRGPLLTHQDAASCEYLDGFNPVEEELNGTVERTVR